eukprot:6173098-Pleurochrysis_carterae.AAC.1
MHDFPICIRIACVLAERSRSLPKLLELAHDGRCRSLSAPSLSHPVGAPQPPRLRLVPALRRLCFVIYRRLQRVPDGTSDSDPVENQNCKARQLRCACDG